LIRAASFGELDPVDLYRILHLRSAVFGVEQECVYNDLDGRDYEPGALHLWIDHGAEVVSALRVLVEPHDARSIGRVVTAPPARGQGLASSLIDHALDVVGAATAVHLNAQIRLEPWYTRWGFRRSGADLWEDGILHVPMTRPGQ
jgi:ElaA protein